jgi:hypothetical protein
MWRLFKLVSVMLVPGLSLAMARKLQPRTRDEPIPRAFGVAIGAVFAAQAASAAYGHPV